MSAAAAPRSAQTFALPNGERVDGHLSPAADDAALQIEAVVDKAPLAEPHALYLPMPTALGEPMALRLRDRRRGGRLDDEQLPYASRALHHDAALHPASPTTGTS